MGLTTARHGLHIASELGSHLNILHFNHSGRPRIFDAQKSRHNAHQYGPGHRPSQLAHTMPIRLIDKWSVGETPTGATETVALPETQKLSVNRIGMEHTNFPGPQISSG